VMGPDCGTAIINGTGLGFANNVRRGNIGLVGASGTGIQAITSQVHNLGSGISQAIGTGGRDLKASIGAITAIHGLGILANDDDTKVIILVSKPPDSETAIKLLGVAKRINKPIVVNFIGYPPPSKKLGNLFFVSSLDEAAEKSVELSKSKKKITLSSQDKSPGFLRGLFSGGTLAYEMLLGLQTVLSPLYSNIPITPDQNLEDPINSIAHTIVDLGEDIFTVGRLHPMIDNDLRLRRIAQEVEDPETGIILLDVVLGEGAHPNPAEELAAAIKEGSKSRPDIKFLAIVIGTDEDPQDIESQINQLKSVGTEIFTSVSSALIHLNQLYMSKSETQTVITVDGFSGDFAGINFGLESFHESLISQGAQSVHVDWKPPAGGNEKLMGILAQMKT
ncbi:MAG: acyl-CoA synthetase FdrA, partial [Chloroflexota bacterium]